MNSLLKGTSIDQDQRWQKNLAKLKKATKFPAIFSEKVDMGRVNREQIKKWSSAKLLSLFEGLEDEVLINYIEAYLDQDNIDPQEMLLSINEMLERDAAPFMEELWTLLVDAQQQPGGIPKELVQAARADVRSRYTERDRVSHGMRHAGHHKDFQRDDRPHGPTGGSERSTPYDSENRGGGDRREGRRDGYRREEDKERNFSERERGPRPYRGESDRYRHNDRRNDRYDERDGRRGRYGDREDREREGRARSSSGRREDHYSRPHERETRQKEKEDNGGVDAFGRDARPSREKPAEQRTSDTSDSSRGRPDRSFEENLRSRDEKVSSPPRSDKKRSHDNPDRFEDDMEAKKAKFRD